MYIGSHSGIAYLRFALRLAPIAVFGLVLAFLVIAFVYRRTLFTPVNGPADTISEPRYLDSRTHRWLRTKSTAVTVGTVLLFFTGLPLELIALAAASLLLLGRVQPRKIYAQVDWSLLILFTGLFLVAHSFRIHVVSRWNIEGWTWLLQRPVDLLSLVSVVLSNLVSNVPAVLLLEPVLQAIAEPSRETAWLALAMSSTLAGNLTMLGSVANLIVVELAGREGVPISFREYCRVGVPLTILALTVGILWLGFVAY
jgi:Na+/H+ antiporter NhaD/arsenite permease-like protein